jgi:hypothetical protein
VRGEPLRTDRLALRIGRRNVCLLARNEIGLGKQRDSNDVVLRCAPSPGSEERTDCLSRRHATLALTERGAVWRNLACANGTLINDRLLNPGVEAVLASGAVVRPAAVVSLRCELSHDDPLLGQEEAYRELAGTESGGVPAVPTGPASSVRLVRLDLAEEYLMVPRGALVGSDPRCAVRVEDAAPVHARLLYLGGAFWLEPAPGETLELTGLGMVPADHVVPLRPGQEFRAGTARLTVAGFGQWFLDAEPPA